MSLPFLLEIGTEEIPDWMIPGALENLRLLFEKLEIPHEIGDARRHAAPPGAARRRACPSASRIAKSACSGPAKSAPAQAVAGFARKQGVEPEELAVESTAKGEYYVYHQEGRRAAPPATSWPKRCRADPQIYFPEDDVLDRQGRPALHPARSAGSSRCWATTIVPFELAGVRSGALTSGHRTPGRARSRCHLRRLRAAAARPLRDPLGRRAAREDRERDRGHRVQSRIRRCSKPWSISPNFPTPITGQLRPAVPGAAGRSADHRDAASPEIFLGGGRRRQSRARSSSR